MNEIYDLESAIVSAMEVEHNHLIVCDLAEKLVTRCLNYAHSALRQGNLRESYVMLLKAEALTNTEREDMFFLADGRTRARLRKRCFALLSEFEFRRIYPSASRPGTGTSASAPRPAMPPHHAKIRERLAAGGDVAPPVTVVTPRSVSKAEFEAMQAEAEPAAADRRPSAADTVKKPEKRAPRVLTSEERLQRAKVMRERADRRTAEREAQRQADRSHLQTLRKASLSHDRGVGGAGREAGPGSKTSSRRASEVSVIRSADRPVTQSRNVSLVLPHDDDARLTGWAAPESVTSPIIVPPRPADTSGDPPSRPTSPPPAPLATASPTPAPAPAPVEPTSPCASTALVALASACSWCFVGERVEAAAGLRLLLEPFASSPAKLRSIETVQRHYRCWSAKARANARRTELLARYELHLARARRDQPQPQQPQHPPHDTDTTDADPPPPEGLPPPQQQEQQQHPRPTVAEASIQTDAVFESPPLPAQPQPALASLPPQVPGEQPPPQHQLSKGHLLGDTSASFWSDERPVSFTVDAPLEGSEAAADAAVPSTPPAPAFSSAEGASPSEPPTLAESQEDTASPPHPATPQQEALGVAAEDAPQQSPPPEGGSGELPPQHDDTAAAADPSPPQTPPQEAASPETPPGGGGAAPTAATPTPGSVTPPLPLVGEVGEGTPPQQLPQEVTRRSPRARFMLELAPEASGGGVCQEQVQGGEEREGGAADGAEFLEEEAAAAVPAPEPPRFGMGRAETPDEALLEGLARSRMQELELEGIAEQFIAEDGAAVSPDVNRPAETRAEMDERLDGLLEAFRRHEEEMLAGEGRRRREAEEARAAVAIQSAWRAHRARGSLTLLQAKRNLDRLRTLASEAPLPGDATMVQPNRHPAATPPNASLTPPQRVLQDDDGGSGTKGQGATAPERDAGGADGGGGGPDSPGPHLPLTEADLDTPGGYRRWKRGYEERVVESEQHRERLRQKRQLLRDRAKMFVAKKKGEAALMSLRCLTMRLRVQAAAEAASVGQQLFYTPRTMPQEVEEELNSTVVSIVGRKQVSAHRRMLYASRIQGFGKAFLSRSVMQHKKFHRASKNIQRIWNGYKVRKTRAVAEQILTIIEMATVDPCSPQQVRRASCIAPQPLLAGHQSFVFGSPPPAKQKSVDAAVQVAGDDCGSGGEAGDGCGVSPLSRSAYAPRARPSTAAVGGGGGGCGGGPSGPLFPEIPSRLVKSAAPRPPACPMQVSARRVRRGWGGSQAGGDAKKRGGRQYVPMMTVDV